MKTGYLCDDYYGNLIYIPVWIDLKKLTFPSSLIFTYIYIPVWIDLKEKRPHRFDLLKEIYIPVWIDLKVIVFIFVALSIIFTFQYG